MPGSMYSVRASSPASHLRNLLAINSGPLSERMCSGTPPKWHAKGDYFETCNCQTLCPFIFVSPPTEGNCTVLVGWHIESGKFGDAPLDGFNVAALFHSPGPIIQANYELLADNLLDLSHAQFVHAQFLRTDALLSAPHEVSQQGDTVVSRRLASNTQGPA